MVRPSCHCAVCNECTLCNLYLFNNLISQKTFCHVTVGKDQVKINYGWIPFRFYSFRILVDAASLSHCYGLLGHRVNGFQMLFYWICSLDKLKTCCDCLSIVLLHTMKKAKPTMSTPKYVRWSQEQVTWFWPRSHRVRQPSLLNSGGSNKQIHYTNDCHILITPTNFVGHVWNHKTTLNWIYHRIIRDASLLTLCWKIDELTAGCLVVLWHKNTPGLQCVNLWY